MMPFAIFNLGPPEMLLVGLIALLLFGKRLPEVARSLGKGVTEFKRGLQGVRDEIDEASQYTEHHELPHSAEPQAQAAPKFEPPSSVPAEVGAVTGSPEAATESQQTAATD
jgi:sec-independent protein translocase protein TatA